MDRVLKRGYIRLNAKWTIYTSCLDSAINLFILEFQIQIIIRKKGHRLLNIHVNCRLYILVHTEQNELVVWIRLPPNNSWKSDRLNPRTESHFSDLQDSEIEAELFMLLMLWLYEGPLNHNSCAFRVYITSIRKWRS